MLNPAKFGRAVGGGQSELYWQKQYIFFLPRSLICSKVSRR